MNFQSAILQQLLERELAAGNSVVQSKTWPPYSQVIILAKPFMSLQGKVPHELVMREVGPPHQWKTEIEDDQTREVIACAE